MSDKLNRKVLKRPDAILTRLREGYRWAEDNLHKIILIGGVIFVAAAIWVFAENRMASKKEASIVAFYEAGKVFDKKREALPKETKLSLVEALKTEIQSIDEIGMAYPKSQGALLGYLKMGDFYAEQGAYPQAVSYYQKALGCGNNQFYTVLVYYNLGYLYELSKDYEQSLKHFERITEFNKTRIIFWSFGNRPNAFWLSAAYFGMGRAYEKLGRIEEAQNAYLRVFDEFPNTPFADKAESLAWLVEKAPKQ